VTGALARPSSLPTDQPHSAKRFSPPSTPTRSTNALTTLARLLPALLLLTTAAAEIATCTPEQTDAYLAVQQQKPTKCPVQEIIFKACDDDCLAHYQRVVAAAPNCSIGGIDLEIKGATSLVERCEGYRNATTPTYMPKDSPGLRNCTEGERNTDAYKNERNETSPFRACTLLVTSSRASCPPDCLKVFETATKEAPPCATDGAFSAGELRKGMLVKCINAIDGNLKGNKVLQAVVAAGTDGEASKSASTSAASRRTQVVSWVATAMAAAVAVVGLV
jgi:hypothetical protein